MNQENREFEIDLLQLCKAVLAKAKYILLVTVIFAMCGFAGSKLLLKPVYESTVKMIVITQNNADEVSNDRLNSAKSLVDTYAIVLKNRELLSQVIDDLDLAMSPEQLAGCISVRSVNKTEAMQVSVRHTDQQIALAVAQKIELYAEEYLEKSYGVGDARILEAAYAKGYPVSPNNKSNAILAALIGFALSCALVAVLFLMDNTYKSNAEIQEDLDVPVLGVIPKIECCGQYSRYGYKYGYGYGYGYGQPAQKGKNVQEEK